MRKFLFLFLLLFFQITVFAQLRIPGLPVSKQYHLKEKIIPISIPHQQPPKQEVLKKTSEPQPLVAGYTIKLSDSLLSQGSWEQSPSGVYVWRLALQLNQAGALNLYFKNFRLNPEDRLYIYNADQTKILGAFSRLNNGPFLATSYIKGSEIVLELDASQKYKTLPFQLELLGNIKDTKNSLNNGFGTAGSCEVPINCPEGAYYQNQKRGVARILLLSQGTLYWCTGSLVNDTKNDAAPYFLTAYHCGPDASTSDYSQWLFYFNYESPDCNRPATEPSSQTLSGASFLASAPTSTGSDFKLLLLKDSVPVSYKPYFNGWDASGEISGNGVVIHHPEGDIKMISTYKTPVIPTSYGGTSTNTNGMYWEVSWAATQDGHGVTEGGSSGSPLFNNNGLIIGSLTGGTSSCSNPDSPDYFGRFSKSWDANGTADTSQLKHWLDPNGSSVMQLPGYDPLSIKAIPFFTSNIQKVPVGGYVQYINLSSGPITAYHWRFDGGMPSSSNSKTPAPVYYRNPGSFKVSLTVSFATGQDSLVKTSYISVKPVIYPNPTQDGIFHILLGTYNQSDVSINIYNMLGQKLNTFNPEFTNNGVKITLPHNQNGMYIVQVTNKGMTSTYKVLNFHQ